MLAEEGRAVLLGSLAPLATLLGHLTETDRDLRRAEIDDRNGVEQRLVDRHRELRIVSVVLQAGVIARRKIYITRFRFTAP